MGAAAVADLIGLGAEVHVIDLKAPASEVASHQAIDLRDPQAVGEAVERIGAPVDALFNCAGLAGPPFTGLDVMLVNFAAARHLTGLVVPLMAAGSAVVSVSSAGAYGWEQSVGQVEGLVATPGYVEAREWCEEHPEVVGEGYLLSKQAVALWTMHAAIDLAPHGIRVNCTSPGPTDTPMMPSFESYMGKEFMDRFPKPLGRNSTPEEQAHVLVFLNSSAASYMTGSNVYVDGGFSAGMLTGRLDFSLLAGGAPVGA